MVKAAARNNGGVDPFIVLSIIGIESNYGLNKGRYTVFNALYTQILRMPKRSNWAQRQLVDYLVLCYEDQIPHIQSKDRTLGHLDTVNLSHQALSPIRLMEIMMANANPMIGKTFLPA